MPVMGGSGFGDEATDRQDFLTTVGYCRALYGCGV